MDADELLANYAAGGRAFRFANLSGVNLHDIKLSGANLYFANLSDAKL
ncbi:MAG: pentapeptide repeat-containing protein, partial [Symploca sp. SIO2D2]|nr:pentapeptide repeat-containing protein [Symploca sp. SIO2D2]